jgi:hypothetical protein
VGEFSPSSKAEKPERRTGSERNLACVIHRTSLSQGKEVMTRERASIQPEAQGDTNSPYQGNKRQKELGRLHRGAPRVPRRQLERGG